MSKLSWFFISIIVLTLCSCNSDDFGKKFSRGPVDATAYSKTQEEQFTDLLKKYVNSERHVDYVSWKKSSSDFDTLKSLLQAFSQADTSNLSVEGKKAFYINAYNAMTIDLVLSHYDETLGGTDSPYPSNRSIRNINKLDAKVWDFFKWKISGQNLSLNEIENKILRPMGDARIHFSIVCASLGCPPILNMAFTEKNLNETLDQLAEDFVNSGRNTRIDIEQKEIRTSLILDWFGQDFVITFGSVKNFFAKYSKKVSPELIQEMSLKFDDYDWLLNQATPTETSDKTSGLSELKNVESNNLNNLSSEKNL